MFARLRGIPERYIKEIVANEIRRLDLAKHADKKCGTYRWDGQLYTCTHILFPRLPVFVTLLCIQRFAESLQQQSALPSI